MRRFTLTLLLLTVAYAAKSSDFDDDDFEEEAKASGGGGGGGSGTKSFPVMIEHDLGSGFAKRNTATLKVSMRSVDSTPNVELEKFRFSAEQGQQLLALAKAGGLYRLRVPAAVNAELSDAKGYVQAYLPACALIASRFVEHLVLHLGDNGQILAVDMKAMDMSCVTDPAGARLAVPKKGPALRTSVRVAMGTTGLRPNMDLIADYGVQGEGGSFDASGKPRRTGKDGKPAAGEEDPGILRKYWYLWVPLLLMNLFAAPAPAKKG